MQFCKKSPQLTSYRKTVSFIKQVQTAGIDFLTIHGRQKSTRSSIPVNTSAIRYLRQFVTVPLLFNGDIASLSTAQHIYTLTGVDGVMSARDVLHNPSLFSGEDACTWEAVEVFLNNVVKAPLTFRLVVHHINVMVEGGKSGSPGLLQAGDERVPRKVVPLLSKEERGRLMACRDILELIELLDEVRGVRRLG